MTKAREGVWEWKRASEFKVYTRRDVNDVNYGNELLGAEGCIAVKLKYDAARGGDARGM